MSDPTKILLDRFEDQSQWDKVIDDVPIFMEHDCYTVETGEKDADGKPVKKLVMVLPGEDPPEGGKLLYSVDESKLKSIAGSIERNYREFGKPVKIHIGHSIIGQRDQRLQPAIVGYGVGAKVGPFGPKGRLGILTRQYVEKGYGEQTGKYPERSPEFYPGRSEITALALLKTDPRLPMGMIAYGDDAGEAAGEVVCYGSDFGGAVHYGEDAEPAAKKGKKKADKPPTDAKKPDEPEADDPDAELSPEEAGQALKMFRHAEKHHPAFRSMCQQYAASCAGPTNAITPAPAGKKTEERIDMAAPADETRVDYAALETRLASLETENGRLKSERIVDQLIAEGVKIPDREKEILRFSKLDDAARTERAEEVRVCYAREDRPPTGDFLPIYRGQVEGGGKEPELTDDDMSEVVAYCEDHGINTSDEAKYAMAVKAVKAEKKKSA